MKKMQAGGSVPKMPNFKSPEDRTPKEKREDKRELKKTLKYVKKHGSGLKMKTGGMVNPNSKVSNQTTPGSKGVKSGVNPKAAASKVATGRSGGTSAAPKTAIPKAQLGKIVKMMSGAGKASSASKAGSQAAKKTMTGLNDLKKRGIDFRTAATKKDMQKALTNVERARLKKVLQEADKKFKP